MASIFNLPQHSLLVPFLEGFEKIFLGMEYFNSPFGHFQIIALSYFDNRKIFGLTTASKKHHI